MRIWSLRLCVFLLAATTYVSAQVGNSGITGTVTDPAGAVVAGASIEAKNVDTGVAFSAVSTSTGNYTVSQLATGRYTITVTVKGFKTYTHTNLAVAAAQTLREDVALAVGNTSEQVTVTAEATLLKTETGDLATNITLNQIDELPLMGIGGSNSGTSGYRNWDNIFLTIPGTVNYAASNSLGLNVNGLTIQSNIVEGQEATTRVLGQGGTGQYYQLGQMGVDAIQEMAVQTSNYAPEFGTASSVVINTTMKSGTNQYHGTGYDYFVNEDLNAGNPFSTTGCINSLIGGVAPTCNSAGGSGGKYRPRNRRNDFGGTLGGPVFIPKLYNGHNKTFWFFSYEQYLETTFYSFGDGVPVPAYLKGDFSAISPNGNCSLCSLYGIQTTALGTPTVQKDALGNSMFANEIYDPLTRGTVASTGLGYATPFPNNMVPANRISPLSLKFQALFPAAQNANLTANYTARIPGQRYSVIPSIKLDHNIDAKNKLSFFYSENNTESQVSSPLGNADGLPLEIGAYRGTFIPTYTYRINYDRTITPTVLLHLGAGYIHTSFDDHAGFLNFDPSQFGLTGFLHPRQFPSVTGMCVIPLGASTCTGYGGMQSIGTAGQIQSTTLEEKPTYNLNLTWVKGKHTFKFGGTLVEEATNPTAYSGVTLATGTGPTSQPFTPTQAFNGFSTGFGYASFLLGDYSSSAQTAQTDPRNHDMDWSAFAQDSWKVTRKLTLDYGIRWDLYGVETEQYNRLGQLDMTLANANAGGHPGAVKYASTCNCSFYQPAYKLAFGPRIGLAYQINPKTVLRAGWGFTYALTEALAGGSVSTNGAFPLSGINPYVNDQTTGFIPQPAWPVTDPNRYPVLGTVGGGGGTTVPDANQNRPPRVNQFSIGIQREITRNFVLEAEYVGNRAAWLGGFLGYLSQISPAQYAKLGLYPYPGTGPAGYNYKPAALSCTAGNDCDRALLSQSINSATVIQKLAAAGVSNITPYSGFPQTNSLLSAMYPFPQFGAIAPSGSATGNSKYDSLQIKATKRLSHHLVASGFFTWAQGFTRAVRQDFFNPDSTANTLMGIPPRVLNFTFTYTTPKVEALDKWKFVNTLLKDWQLSGFANYQSGVFLAIPGTPNAEQLATQDTLVAGQPLYNKDINGQINPWTDQILNPNAWAACPVNTNCGNSGNDFLKNFRGRRRPSENANIGRNFRINERFNLQIRGEFVNIFNRTLFPALSTASPQNPVTKNALGILTAGFGTIAAYQAPGTSNAFTARTGTLIVRLQF